MVTTARETLSSITANAAGRGHHEERPPPIHAPQDPWQGVIRSRMALEGTLVWIVI